MSLGATIGVLFGQLNWLDSNREKYEYQLRQQQEENSKKIDVLTNQIELTNKIILCQNEVAVEKARSPVNQTRVDILEQQLSDLIRQLNELRGGDNGS